MESQKTHLEQFKEYFNQKIDSELETLKKEEEERLSFIAEYPLDRIQKLTYEEYCLGTEQSKDSFCYKIEFGKYKKTGFSIGGATAKKYGVYYSKKEESYKHGNEAINIDEFWPEFIKDLYIFLVESGKQTTPLVLEDYPRLQGMAMVLTKLLSIFYPEKYITIGSNAVLKELMSHFQYDSEEGMRCHQLNALFNSNIRRDFLELSEYDGKALGKMAWQYIDGEQKKHHGNYDKEPGLGNEDVLEKHYWLYSPGHNAFKWPEYSSEGIMGIGWGELGDLSEFENQNAIRAKMKEVYGEDKSYKMDSLATWQFANEIKEGDVIYAKKGMYKIVGRGVVTSGYYYDDEIEDDYQNFREVEWNYIGEWDYPGQAAMKTLTDISFDTDRIEKLEALFEGALEVEPVKEEIWQKYSKEKFLDEVFLDESAYDTLVNLIYTKKNVILQGAPGVGKTYAANRLAYSIMGEKDKDRVMMVQFHQSYSYEDFIEGFRPASEGNGFEIKKGSFYKFCKRAAEDKENEYFFIIDEINRGNLSKIFGELFMLIEKDKRENSLQLLYSDEKFYVPKNVYIIGMMNTADRSLAMLDYALRRRFAFYDLKPAFDQQKFIDYRMSLDSTKFNSLIECVKKLNEAIRDDASLGEGFCIGHSYFCNLKEVSDSALKNIVEYELLPLLNEYWFDDQATVRDWAEKLRSSIK